MPSVEKPEGMKPKGEAYYQCTCPGAAKKTAPATSDYVARELVCVRCHNTVRVKLRPKP